MFDCSKTVNSRITAEASVYSKYVNQTAISRMRELLLQPRNSSINGDNQAAIFWNACVSAYYHCRAAQRGEVFEHWKTTLDRLEKLISD
jgi:hypothetical protein